MSRDPVTERIMRLEVRIDNLTRALSSHASITEQLRASHDHSIRMISDAIHRTESLDLGAVLASLEYDPKPQPTPSPAPISARNRTRLVLSPLTSLWSLLVRRPDPFGRSR